MINYVRGILTDIEENMIVVEAEGIGYGIRVPASVMGELPKTGDELMIYTYFSVKEDSMTLFGFLSKEDREMFRQLIGVNGVGPKGALAILSVLRPDDLRMAVMSGDAKSISRAQGIGAKTAERVILDLRDKVGEPAFVTASAIRGTGIANVSPQAFSAGPVAEAIEALVMLGYSRTDAGRAAAGVQLTDGMTTEEVLKSALKNIK